MRMVRAQILNFRCLADLTLTFDDVTVFVGANSTGKSTALYALRWLFEGGRLDTDDIHGCTHESTVSVTVTFTDFTDADRAAFGSYIVDGTATITRAWSVADGTTVVASGRAHPSFEGIRHVVGAVPRRNAYNAMRIERPELGLPTARSQQEVEDALATWEEAHPDELKATTVPAEHLLGSKPMEGRLEFVLIPAMSDAEAETTDSRGTLLSQLLELALDHTGATEKLAALEETFTSKMQEIVAAEDGVALDGLASDLTNELRRLVPSAAVLLEPRPPVFRVPALGVDMRMADGSVDTHVGRQGHGVQRALLIAVVQQLVALRGRSESNDQSDPRSLFLAVEEPELCQHPQQARHFAATLASLATIGSTQVVYATHSEHFIDPARFEQLRRFRRRQSTDVPVGEATSASLSEVANLLQGLVKDEEIPTRVRVTLRRQLAEAVFARGVVVVEGFTDGGTLQGLADRETSLDTDGIAIVAGIGKSNLPIPWAILTALEIPVLVVFDGDSGRPDRVKANALHGRKSAAEADLLAQEATSQVVRDNRALLSLLGADPVDHPETAVTSRLAVFGDRLEDDLAAWDGYQAHLENCSAELGDRRAKSDDVYRDAAAGTPGDPPEVFMQLMHAIRALPTREGAP